MKARLAQKIANTPINRLSDYWFDKAKEGSRRAHLHRHQSNS